MSDIRNTPAWRRMSRECFKRDKARNAKCWICGQDIDYSLKASSADEAYEPDHRYDVHTHPELGLVPENVLPSHRSCNRSRGKRAHTQPLGNQSRIW